MLQTNMIIKTWMLGITYGWYKIIQLLQIETQFTNVSLLITAIITLASTIGLLYYQNIKLNKIIKDQAEANAREQKDTNERHTKEIKEINQVHADEMKRLNENYRDDFKTLIINNTTALNTHSAAVNSNTSLLQQMDRKIKY